MATLVTPSAKSHERVTGRWTRDIQAENSRDWAIYYAKVALGTPIPPLLILFLFTIFVGRAAVEISAWTLATLVLGYIVVDLFGKNREFGFSTLGADLWLIGFGVVAMLGLGSASGALEFIDGVGTLRWIPLTYLFAFTWRLFPGLNRVFLVLSGVGMAVAAYAVAQHFIGLDLLRGTTLTFAPLKGFSYAIVTGFFRHPEILGTIMAVLLPFPIAEIMLSEGREKPRVATIAIGAALLMGVAVLWTYRPGLWLAAVAGSTITVLLQAQRKFIVVISAIACVAAVLFAVYGSPETLSTQVAEAEQARAARQREQINMDKQIWSEHPWIGAGMKGQTTRSTETLDGNVYFHLLARTGGLGLALYLLFSLMFLQNIYRTWCEVPKSHHWHRVLTSGGIGSLIAFHAAGLYWSTLGDSHTMNLYAFLLGSLGYLRDQYSSALVTDDYSL